MYANIYAPEDCISRQWMTIAVYMLNPELKRKMVDAPLFIKKTFSLDWLDFL